MPGKNHVKPVQHPVGTSLHMRATNAQLVAAHHTVYQELVASYAEMSLEKLEEIEADLETREDVSFEEKEIQMRAIDHARRLIARNMIAAEKRGAANLLVD